ncbi:ubiquitin carboxyl-terminal hydrolase 10-like [Gigantopelta aegis]|uniref:ubiquitin carboxyl-terminal hydrolase 10-like n=1 Tax=Gigantopelta aegis TaxID=1735272 RepID=UPI001B88C5C9|nr:ubiquitin carboxyl-terminal hydrolase 10-like [Gigantopelta aegis]
MESSEQFSFGDFSDLLPDDYQKIHIILHGRKDGIKHVEFPWDTCKEPWAVPHTADGEGYHGNTIADVHQVPPMGIPPQFVPCLVAGMPPIPAMVPVGAYPMGHPHIVNGLPVPTGQVAQVVPYPQYGHPASGSVPSNLPDNRYCEMKNEGAGMTAKCAGFENEDCELRDVIVDSASKPVCQQVPKTDVEFSGVPYGSAVNKVEPTEASMEIETTANAEKPSAVNDHTEAEKRVDENDTRGNVGNDSISKRTTDSMNAQASSQMGESSTAAVEAESHSPEPQTAVVAESYTTEDSVAFDKNDPPLPSHGATSPSSEPSVAGSGPVQVRTWAALFKNEKTANMAKVTYIGAGDGFKQESPANATNKKNETVELPVPVSEDSAASKLGDFLLNVKLEHKVIALQPRGLVNRGNWCYINATLQALVACPPFYHLLKKLSTARLLTRGPSSTPILDSFVDFVKKFSPMTRLSGPRNRRSLELVSGPAFEPENIYRMLQVIEVNHCFKLGKQEDAEEFLSCILDGLHEEMAAAISAVTNDSPVNGMAQPNGYIEDEEIDEEEDETWQQVGPKKKSVQTRRASFAKTPIGDIFAGQIRSAVYRATSAESANLQPFFTLQLDIQNEKIWTVCDALDGLVCKEMVHGYTCSKTKEEVEAARKITLEELPSVLILHLKCFVYDQKGGCQKLLKKIDFEVDLQIKKEMLSATAKSKVQTAHRTYKLFAVVFHHGKNATGGHYTTNVFHPGISSWVKIDDSRIQAVSVQEVLKFSAPRMPYLLYYRRIDLA